MGLHRLRKRSKVKNTTKVEKTKTPQFSFTEVKVFLAEFLGFSVNLNQYMHYSVIKTSTYVLFADNVFCVSNWPGCY